MLRRILAGLSLGAALASTVSAQTVDEIVARNIQARGGADKIKSVRSARMTGTMTMGGIVAPIVMTQRRPSDNRMEFTFQGMTGIRAYDGKHAWMVMPFMGKKDPEELPADIVAQIADQADIDGPLVDYKSKGHQVELVGKEQVEGTEAYKLKVTLKSGNVRTMYLDAKSYLEIASEGKAKIRGTETEIASSIGGYKEVDGMMVPFSISSGAKGVPQREAMTFETIEFNVDAHDSLFALPANARPASLPPAAEAKSADGAAPADSAKATTVQKPATRKPTGKGAAKKP